MKPTLRVLLAGPVLLPVSAWGQEVTNLTTGVVYASATPIESPTSAGPVTTVAPVLVTDAAPRTEKLPNSVPRIDDWANPWAGP